MAYDLDIITPAQTSATAPFTVTQSAYSGIYAGWKAFDHSVGGAGGDDWWQILNGTTGWVKICVPGNARVITDYAITDAFGGIGPKAWTLQGSNDDINWVTIDSRTNETGWAPLERRVFFITGSFPAYTYYKLDITATNSPYYLYVGEIELNAPPANINATISSNLPILAGSMFAGGYIHLSLPALKSYYIGNSLIYGQIPIITVDTFVAGIPILRVAGALPAMIGNIRGGAGISGSLKTFSTVSFHAGMRVSSKISASIPSLAVDIKTGARVAIKAPALTCSSVVSSSIPASVEDEFPIMYGDIRTGVGIDIALIYALSGTLAVTVGNVAFMSDMVLPQLQGNIIGLTQQFAQIDGVVGFMSGTISIKPDIFASISNIFPRVSGSVYSYTGRVSNVSMIFPIMNGHLSGYQHRNAQISGNLSMLKRLM